MDQLTMKIFQKVKCTCGAVHHGEHYIIEALKVIYDKLQTIECRVGNLESLLEDDNENQD